MYRWFAITCCVITVIEYQSCYNNHDEISEAVLNKLKSSWRDGLGVGYCTKFLGADLEKESLLGDRLVAGMKNDQFVWMVRVFSGSIKSGQSFF